MTLRIAALDDDPSILYTLEAMAKTQGWSMTTTTDPETCLEWVRSGGIDLLLLDVHMPQVNGMEILQRAKAADASLGILMLTVEEGQAVAQECLLLGADDYINKPVRLADFSARIRLHEQLVRRRRDLNWDQNRKGIGAETLRRVLEALRGAEKALEIGELAEFCGLSYQSAHRYLEHLVERGLARRRPLLQDGRPGRPRMLYAPIRDGRKSGSTSEGDSG